jgi:hypothetical protein
MRRRKLPHKQAKFDYVRQSVLTHRGIRPKERPIQPLV